METIQPCRAFSSAAWRTYPDSGSPAFLAARLNAFRSASVTMTRMAAGRVRLGSGFFRVGMCASLLAVWLHVTHMAATQKP